MCGIAGYCLLHSSRPQELEALASQMGAAISHRGPDAAGAWAEPAVGVALAHQRLAVLDLSAAGHQPMHSSGGRYVIAFNGEVYNHLSLRGELEKAGLAPSWRGSSDTETLLAAIEAWGLEAALQRCTGMWALALVDRRERRLHLARDRFGEKPLYWGLTGSGQHRALVFGSELAALRAYPGFDNPIDPQALAEFLQFSQVPAPLSIYSGIFKLLAGHRVSIPLPLQQSDSLPESRSWWQLSDVIQAGYAHPLSSCAESLELLEDSLCQAVDDQAIADVPLGAFLSGGIDSSLVTSLMQRNSVRPVRTFTIAFEESGFNEAPYARSVAAYLGTDHAETFLTSADAQQLIPQLPQLYTEPFADSSQLATHLVCREARRAGLVVALTGDGGDELFGGYNRYALAPRIWNSLERIPLPLRRNLGRTITVIPPSFWDVLGSAFPLTNLGQKAHNLAAKLRFANDSDQFYSSLTSVWANPASILQDYRTPALSLSTSIDHALLSCLGDDAVARMMASDTLGYLVDDILVKVDRAAMAVGLETRAPFLDHRVAAAAWRLPMDMKMRAGTGKWALRQILYKYVPRELIDRPKAGFAIPIGQWLRGPLRVWVDELLNPDRLQREGYLRPEPIFKVWQQHLSGRYDHTNKLWTVLMWQDWLEKWG